MKKNLIIKKKGQLAFDGFLPDTLDDASTHASIPVERFAHLQKLVQQQIYIGTSGYSYDDWIGPFYPSKIKKPQMLEYYQRFFPCVELNFSYYSMPSARTLFQIREKAPETKFSIKAHQSITHERKEGMEPWKNFGEALTPLKESDQLASVLFQFPYSFHHAQPALEYLLRIAEYFEQYPLVFEFRHSSWFTEKTFDILRKKRLGICSVDAPRLKGLTSNIVLATNHQGYYRLHGRNAERWFDGDNVTRYDYQYAEKEINELVHNITKLKETSEEVFVYANNHPKGQAIETAIGIADALSKQGITE